MPFILVLEKTTNTYNEYTPLWVKQDIINNKYKSKIEFIGKQAKIAVNTNKSNLIDFSMDIMEDGITRINTIYYPGWHVYVNNKNTKINFENSGLIEFFVTKGKYNIKAKFEETFVRKLSNILSIVTLIIILLGVIHFQKKEYE